jgi:exodeoxyribonuclease-3
MNQANDTQTHPQVILSWNVNSVRVRLEQVKSLIQEQSPDVLALQEIKCTEDDFPTDEFRAMGYHSIIAGQKQYHGVAILYKQEYTAREVKLALPGCDLDEARYIEAVIGPIRLSNLYVPNGFDIDSQSYYNKIKFLNALCFNVHERMQNEDIWVMTGDFNVIPRTLDTIDKSSKWESTGMASPVVRRFWYRLINQGWLDAGENTHQMTWQDYKNPNIKLRIDHALLSPGASDALVSFEVLPEWRKKERPSDHMPVRLVLDSSRPRILLSKWRWNAPIRDTLLGVKDMRDLPADQQVSQVE